MICVPMKKTVSFLYRRYTDEWYSHQQKSIFKHPLRAVSFVVKPVNDDTGGKSLFHNGEIYTSEQDILSWLHTMAPGFSVNGSQVIILHEPSAFYKTLVEKCQTARKRITLASLYLGTGQLEKQLVSAIGENLARSRREDGGQLQVTVLLDYQRGSRGPVSSRDVLAPLLRNHGAACQVCLYHTPLLREPLRSLLPGRATELVGLQHMKVYLFDDSLLISGANLSHEYFTARQDRYMLVENCAPLADFYAALVARVCEFSLRLAPGGGEALRSDWHVHPYRAGADPAAFCSAARARVRPLLAPAPAPAPAGAGDTWLFPLVQMGQLGLRHDSEVTARLLAAAPAGASLSLATGYFNLTAEYADCVLRRSRAAFRLLTAHPSANGFAGAKGLAGAVPLAYCELASRFLRRARSLPAGAGGRVQLEEFSRPGWTFHAKGLWLTLPGRRLPCLTLVGSPNFGWRSVLRDLETQLALVTASPALQAALAAESERLWARAEPLKERDAPLWVRWLVRAAPHYF